MEMNYRQVTREHVIPISIVRRLVREGTEITTFQYSDNEVPACWKCNNEQGRRSNLFTRLHKLEKIRTFPLVPRDAMIKAERGPLELIGSDFVEWKY